jgi:hypothetical protein
MANVPSSTTAIRPTAIPARCARSSAFAEAGFLTDALSARGMSNCRAILGGNAMGITDRVVRSCGTRAEWAQWVKPGRKLQERRYLHEPGRQN